MAVDTHRTARHEATDALLRLADAEKALAETRVHLLRVAANPEPGIAIQARRTARILAAAVDDVVRYSCEARRLAEVEAAESTTPLKSVS